MIALPAGPALHARVHLAAGKSLLAAASEAMARLSLRSANLLILGGPMASALYHTSVLTPDGPRWIDYGPAQTIPEPAWLVMGAATFGIAGDGSPIIHCHAVLSGGGRVVGGHLPPERCIIGAEGLIAHATGAEHTGFIVQHDSESSFDLLTPACLPPC